MKSQSSDTEKKIWLKKVKEKDLMKLLGKMYKYKTNCLKCKKNTDNINPRVSKTSNNKTTLLWKRTICGSEKSRFIKEQETGGLLSSLGIKTPLNKILLLANVLFWMI